MSRRKAHRARVLRDVAQAKPLPFVQRHAQEAAPARRSAEGDLQLGVDPGGDEGGDLPQLVHHRDRAVEGAEERPRPLDHGLEDRVERQVGGHHEGGGVELQQLAVLAQEPLFEPLQPAEDLLIEEREEDEGDGENQQAGHPER